MKLPWGTITQILPEFIRARPTSIIACLSFEERCIQLATLVHKVNPTTTSTFVEVLDPLDVQPNYREQTALKVAANHSLLVKNGVGITNQEQVELLATEDSLLELYRDQKSANPAKSVVLDITSFPKRFFCFLLKRLLLDDEIANVLLTYTQPGPKGYFLGPLAEAPLHPDYLPGFSPGIEQTDGDHTLVISVGFETQSARTLLPICPERSKQKLLMSFPPNGAWSRRQFRSVREMATVPSALNREDVKVVAAWDTSSAYGAIRNWRTEHPGGVTFAPFGPKPHTIAMALSAIEFNIGMLYTQPRAYTPEYSNGFGSTWAYLVKWDGVRCYDRV